MSIHIREIVSRFFGRYGSALKRIYVVLLTATLFWTGYIWYPQNLQFWHFLFSGTGSLRIIAQSVGLLFVLVIADRFTKYYEGRIKFLGWRLFGRNINFFPLHYPFLRYPFLAVFYFSLPVLAYTEELIFRHGFGVYPTTTWLDAAFRSLFFGLVHCIGGVPLRAGLILSIGGFWFSQQYFQGGLLLASVSHFIYNAIAMTYLLVAWIWTKKNPFD
ncbi:MAG: hypothetical protein Q7S09_01235 [bacterium]|nr:hypothetical protein [bacterium]